LGERAWDFSTEHGVPITASVDIQGGAVHENLLLTHNRRNRDNLRGMVT
jgi:hypothetical protein